MHGVATEHTFSRCCSKTSPNEARPFTNLSLSLSVHTRTRTHNRQIRLATSQRETRKVIELYFKRN